MSWIDSALGIHPAALQFHSQRSSALAANIANEGTPGYKARDYDFDSVMRSLAKGTEPGLRTTSSGHLTGAADARFGNLQYRVPTKPLVEGNSVEPEVEQAVFAENALRYQASLQFLEGAFAGLRLAIRGQR
ncbi:MAG: flagellar basal body rod protein FlgB [Gammaproteobacteria bacterium]|nr:flagellar basal body rod protein FlgB [Pseudomonadales bacterium]MCP5349029.1 flagellar basal body rod protein FlgB [Pseudomonadales bacterium]